MDITIKHFKNSYDLTSAVILPKIAYAVPTDFMYNQAWKARFKVVEILIIITTYIATYFTDE